MKFIQVSFLELRLNLSKMKEGKKKKKQSTTPQEKKKRNNIKTRHSRTLKQMERASICFSKKKKEFIMEALKQV